MKDLYLDYKVPEDLQDNKFIQSLANQYKVKDLSTKQINALKDILEIPEDLPTIKYKQVDLYLEYYFRTDYHGDYLQDHKIVYKDFDLSEKIQDGHAAQYSCEKYIDKYKFYKTVQVPENIKNILDFEYHLTYFENLIEKLQRNRFRKVRTRNKCIREINLILNEKYSELNMYK